MFCLKKIQNSYETHDAQSVTHGVGGRYGQKNLPFWTEVKGLCSHIPVLCGARRFCLENSGAC